MIEDLEGWLKLHYGNVDLAIEDAIITRKVYEGHNHPEAKERVRIYTNYINQLSQQKLF